MLGEIVRTAADRFGDRQVLCSATDALTYRDLDAVHARARALNICVAELSRQMPNHVHHHLSLGSVGGRQNT